MIQLGISDISKNPSLIDKVDDLVEIFIRVTALAVTHISESFLPHKTSQFL